MTTVSVIGTAGRKNKHKLNNELYDKMINKVKDIIENKFNLNPNNITLVSGGAAWCDHLAVNLFLDNYVKNSTLYLPCDWNFKNKKYLESINMYDCGKVANSYHYYFSEKLGKNTLHEINDAISNGLSINTKYYGFKNRNTQVAISNYLIAFTFSKGNEPDDGGTKDTWNKSNSNKIHICLDEL